jgi:hypothetical protein
MTETENTLTYDDIFLFIKRIEKDLTAFSETISRREASNLLPKLRETVSKIGSKPERRPPPLEVYMRQWEEFLAGKRDQLDRSTVRYLCWEPKIALHEKFLTFIGNSSVELNARSLQGLVHSCHREWDFFIDKRKSIGQVRNSVSKYGGLNRVLSKWKASIDAVLGLDGPAKLAERLVFSENTLEKHLEEWYLDGQSSYVHHMVAAVSEKIRYHLGRDRTIQLLFSDVLPWEGWQLTDFKKEIGNFILHREAEKIWDQLQIFVLKDKRLGDPRLPAARKNWAEVPVGAVNRLLESLCREDIFFFFEHVYSSGVDRHHRRDFWLNYVGRCTASRPLLCRNDRIRLRPVLARENIKIGHFGRLRAVDNSAFLLTFGELTVVEFSKVGRCFIYASDHFHEMVNYWTNAELAEAELKEPSRCIAAIRHLNTTNIDWRDRVRMVLAHHGIRPGGGK